MNVWRKVLRWESQFEHGPKQQIIKLILAIFGISVLAGYGVSMGIKTQKIKAYENWVNTVRTQEQKSMNERIKLLQLQTITTKANQ